MSAVIRPLASGLAVLAVAAASAFGGIGVSTAMAHPSPAPHSQGPEKPPCPTEDSPGPCHWDAQTQGNGKGTSFDAPPYCMVDSEVSAFLTVAGPAGGWVTVNGKDHKALTLVTDDDYGDEVRPDAGPFTGLLYNVPGPGVVEVDGIVCETT